MADATMAVSLVAVWGLHAVKGSEVLLRAGLGS